MKKYLSNYWKAFLTVLFGMAVFLFWRYAYPFALSYQEQFQLFQSGDSYFMERIALPGGLVRYAAEFLVQFYYYLVFGSIILAVLFVLIQLLTWLLMKRQMPGMKDNADFLYPLSFLPVLSLWYLLGDENVLLGYVVALAFGLLFMWLYPKKQLARIVFCLVGIPLIYWLIGPMVLMTALYIAVVEWQDGKIKGWLGIGVGIVSVLLALLCILVSAWFLPYPLLRLFSGIGYYRGVQMLPLLMYLIPLMVIILICLSHLSFRVSGKNAFWPAIITVCVIVLAGFFVPKGFDEKKYDLMEYDYLVRSKDWNGVIAKSEKRMPDLPMSVCATNLALAMNNQLGNRAFEFYQRGVEGLLPPFDRNPVSVQLTGEVYYYLGLINTAQRFAFESMEALPDYNKSARAVKRLVETNLINGEYSVARKYAEMLRKTFCYRGWAEKMEDLMTDEKRIDAHSLYGWLRQIRLQEDFLFSEDEVDKICGQLFMRNPKNVMATQYLLLCPLLNRDITLFMQYVQVVQGQQNYNPRSCQEAIAFAFAQNNQQPPQGVVSPVILKSLSDFGRIVSNSGTNAPELEAYRSTVWYYLMKGQ